jgi:hypothetical protein
MEKPSALVLDPLFVFFTELGILYDSGKFFNGEKMCSVITNHYEFVSGCDKKKSPRKIFLSPNDIILYNATVKYLKNQSEICSGDHSNKKKGKICCRILKGCFYGYSKTTYVNCLYFKPHVVKIINREVPRYMYATKMEMDHLKLFLNKVAMFPSIEFRAIVYSMGGSCGIDWGLGGGGGDGVGGGGGSVSASVGGGSAGANAVAPDIIVIEAVPVEKAPVSKKRERDCECERECKCEIIYDDSEEGAISVESINLDSD